REFHRAFVDELFVISPDVGHLFDPRTFPFGAEVELHFLDFVNHLTQHKFGVPDDTDFGRDVPTHTLWCCVHLNVRRFVTPGWWLTEFVPAPVFEPNSKDDIGFTSEWLLPGPTNRQRVCFVNRALSRTAAIHRRASQLS